MDTKRPCTKVKYYSEQGANQHMVDTVQQLCMKSYETTTDNKVYWKAEQGKIYTTSVPIKGKKRITVFSDYWALAPKKHFVLIE